MNKLKTTNILLLIIVIPIVFYILKILSFIFIPLIFSMFIALLFLPIMRWLKNHKVPKPVSILIIVIIIAGLLMAGGELVKLSSKEILSADVDLINKAETKLVSLIVLMEMFFGIERLPGENVLVHYFQVSSIIENLSSTLNFIGNTLSMILRGY